MKIICSPPVPSKENLGVLRAGTGIYPGCELWRATKDNLSWNKFIITYWQLIFLLWIFQTVANAVIFLYLGSIIVVGRPRSTDKKTSQQSIWKRFLRGQNFNEKTNRLQKLRSESDTDLQVVVDRSNIDHLERFKRDVTSNPCFKPGTYELITLSENKRTYKIECKSSTLIGCFSAIRTSFRTTKCLEKKVMYSGKIFVQDCECAS